MYTSLLPQVRKANYHLLIKTYWEALVSTLTMYGFKGRIPDKQEIIEDMEKSAFSNLVTLAVFFPVVTTKHNNAMDLNKDIDSPPFNEEIYYECGLKEKIGQDILEMIENGSLD